jgi:hypothetical protein
VTSPRDDDRQPFIGSGIIIILVVACVISFMLGDFIGHRGCLAPTSSDTLTQPPAH